MRLARKVLLSATVWLAFAASAPALAQPPAAQPSIAQASLAQASLAQASLAPTADRIAFAFVQDRQVLFPIVINGRPAEAWLDSGASATVLDAAFAQSLGLALHGEMRANGVAGRVAGVRLAKVDMQVGHLLFPQRPVAVMDLQAVSAVVQRPVQVILGRDIFDHAIVDIDFRSRSLELLPAETFQPPAGSAPLPLAPSGGLRTLPIRLGGVETQAVLDLGNAGALLLDRGFADAHRLLAGRRLSTQLAVGADGPRESTVASLDQVEVGGVVFDHVPVTAAAGLSSEAPANVGLALLSRFHLTIDFAGARLWMAPYADAAQTPFLRNRSGLSVVPQGDRLRVTHVAKGSPAAAQHWRAGEAIVAIDGQPIDAGFAASPLSRWSFGPSGTVVALTLRNGATRRLTLADYY